MKKKIVVIGGGAAGLMAAWTAARHVQKQKHKCEVLLLEGNNRVGKKLLATGNGRCNLSNMHMDISNFHGDRQALGEILSACSPEKVLAAFGEMGLLCRSDGEGRVYPYNLQAAAVLTALRRACKGSGVEVFCDSNVVSLERIEMGFSLRTQSETVFMAEKVIAATGGMASPKHSSDTNGYQLAGSLGHSLVPCRPALVQVLCKSPMIKALKGMRCKAKVTLLQGQKKLYTESGEVLFSGQGLSGICIFNCSSYITKNVEAAEKYTIELDLAEDMTEQAVYTYLLGLQSQMGRLLCGDMLSGFLNIKVGEEIIRSLKWDRQQPVAGLAAGQLRQLAARIKNVSFFITGLADWDSAQVTAGGIPMSEVDAGTMESKKTPGLYLAGELLNVNGQCGGYNLHFAWATGMAAGKAAAESEKR